MFSDNQIVTAGQLAALRLLYQTAGAAEGDDRGLRWHALPTADLLQIGATDDDLRALVERRFIHACGDSRGHKPRLAAGATSGCGTKWSLSYGGRVYLEANRLCIMAAPHAGAPDAGGTVCECGGLLDSRGRICVEKPIWNGLTRELGWMNERALRLCGQATAEIELLEEWDRLGWQWLIRDPVPCEATHDPTSRRRQTIHRLNERQREHPLLHFGALRGGLLCWCPANWIERSVTIVTDLRETAAKGYITQVAATPAVGNG